MDKLYKNLSYRKDFQLTNTSISPLMVNWANVIGDEIINVEPVVAEIPADATCQFTLILTGTKIGQIKIELPFKLDGVDDYGYLHIEGEIIGPNVEVDSTTLDFGLIEYGQTVEQIIQIKNFSPIIAKCQVKEINQDQMDSLITLPNGTDLILKPIETYDMLVRLTANEEGALLTHLELNIEDNKTIPIEITAIIQRPSAYLSPVELNIDESFLNVPIVRHIKLHAVNDLPTNFHWGKPTCLDPNQCQIEIHPIEGILYHSQSCLIKITFIPKQCGKLNDDWHVPCYIENASQPIFLKINALMKGMNVEFRHEENVFELKDQFTLDFDRVPIGEKSRLELKIVNLTDMESGIRAKIAKFQTRLVSTPNGHKNFEPSDQEIGVGFHLDQPETYVYRLPSRGTAIISLSVISSMWGQYFDNLQLDIEGINFIKEIPVQVRIIGNPIKTYLSTNTSKPNSLPIVQFGSMLHNAFSIKKKVHMQNISHIPIRIDWIVYELTEEIEENPKLIELISVIDNNPFDSFKSETTIMDNNDEIMSRTTISTQSSSRMNSGRLAPSSISSIEHRQSPLIKLYVKPYRGKRTTDGNGVYTVSTMTKIVKPREHFYLDIQMTPRNCSIKDRPIQCHARVVGILSVTEERQGSAKQGFRRSIYYEHEEQIEFEMHASLEMPSLCVELDDDDCDTTEPDALSFAIPVGDILSCQPNLYNCTLPLTNPSSSGQSSNYSRSSHHEKIYKRTLNLLNIRQCTIPFELTISDSLFLSIEPSILTTLISQSKVNLHCYFHLSQDLIDRILTKKFSKTINEIQTIEHGRKLHWREELSIKFQQNDMVQTIPIDIRLYFPILTVNTNRIEFGICFLNQTRQKEVIIKNLTCSSSAWSIRKVHANISDAYEAFRIDPKSGILKTELNSKDKSIQQVVSIYFTARHNQKYECQLLLEGLLGEPPISILVTGEGSYDGKYEAILDI